ncbi:MAG: YggT family protein [Aphanocapsa feldmannii 277cV]|uniref:YggT family protein n=2 Tax=Aphanocapsa feldmannii TaxID=192050 RepID=A0A524RL15_9CHRO|nr:MAG: YggT family protein [Aphanocapsa feldmannii 288cV]TGG90533.1 MAG: YggT family protein [Aphanocapsa feldmannii 277cV]TGH25478.1 MAG: YggT family protein [Aphanocapsa feldmannii 277cI]
MLIAGFLLQVIAQTISIYSLLLIARVLLSWFPNLPWESPVLAGLSSITDPFLNVFRGLIPPIGGIDLSPILAFMALSLSQSLVSSGGASVIAAAYRAMPVS